MEKFLESVIEEHMAAREKPASGDDLYSRVDYRRFVAWPKRIRREAPFLMEVLEKAPTRSVIDLGCGTGEHCRFLAGKGFAAVGLDRSESMLAKAQEQPLPPNLRFVLAELQQVREAVKTQFGAAISLGNTLVHLTRRQDLEEAFASLVQVLEPRGLFLFQILNYERIFEGNIRHLPLSFRQHEDGEIVFLRLMEPLEDGWVRFCPTTLKYDPQADPPVEVVRSRVVELRGWRREDLIPLLENAGFSILSVHGDLIGGLYQPRTSHDLVLVAQNMKDRE
ncbi:MAG: class I SAM-dependent methyltransferase [Acidobacteriota bacterium]